MPPWLEQSLTSDPVLPFQALAVRLILAFLLGCVVAVVYILTTRAPGKSITTPFLATLVLLSILISLVTLVIGNSLARAFGLVGALSIVRFRTVVEDTRDTAFVIFAVVVGMGAGAGYLLAPLAGAPLVLLAAWLFRPRGAWNDQNEVTLRLRLAANPVIQNHVLVIFDRYLVRYRLIGVATARGGAALDVTYVVVPRSSDALTLVAELTSVEGVQDIELKER